MTRLSDYWPAAHIVFFTQKVAEGRSFGQCAGDLLREFGRAYSRNACIGKAHRLGLTSKVTFSMGGKMGARPSRKGKKMTKAKVKPTRPPPPRPIMCDEPVTLNKVMFDMNVPEKDWLADGECKWPVNNGNPFRFCANKCIKMSAQGDQLAYFLPYCLYHAIVANNGLGSPKALTDIPS